MMRSFFLVLFLTVSSIAAFGQGSKQIPKSVPVKEAKKEPLRGTGVSGSTYSNAELAFQVTFPDGWLFPAADFEDQLRAKGFDLSLKAPDTIDKAGQMQIDKYLERVRVLLTTYKAAANSKDNAIIRIAAEDLTLVPQVKDAVDYFDLMRSQFAVMKLPADFKFSETQAEQLGPRQFAFLDTSSKAGKKRMYATVRNRTAIVFTLSYVDPNDLRSFRQILSAANFAYK